MGRPLTNLRTLQRTFSNGVVGGTFMGCSVYDDLGTFSRMGHCSENVKEGNHY